MEEKLRYILACHSYQDWARDQLAEPVLSRSNEELRARLPSWIPDSRPDPARQPSPVPPIEVYERVLRGHLFATDTGDQLLIHRATLQPDTSSAPSTSWLLRMPCR